MPQGLQGDMIGGRPAGLGQAADKNKEGENAKLLASTAKTT
jgi:hypothetical protein